MKGSHRALSTASDIPPSSFPPSQSEKLWWASFRISSCSPRSSTEPQASLRESDCDLRMAADVLTSDIRHEANTALLEVDKGLQSVRVGDQCEAIVKFPVLVDRFPFPVLINAAFLKLAEVFRTGNNFLRLNILKVLQLTEKHLQKIISVDEFIRRIYSVMHSNDSLARGVTLRVFGSVASIVTERKNIHHSVHHGLDSTGKVELDAAIYATSCLCKHSRTFATGVCDKITAMVERLTTPVTMKLRLFPILTLMQHDISTATQVRELCIKLLPAYPSLAFVKAILHTLTELATATLIHVPDQVKLLLYYASGDVRLSVRLKAYWELLQLASKVPQTWTQEMVQGFFSVVGKSSTRAEKVVGVRILYKLATTLAVHNMAFLKDFDSFLPFCYSDDLAISAYSMGVVTRIVMATTKGSESKEEQEEVEEIGDTMVESLLLMDHSRLADNMIPYKVLLSNLVLLATNPVVSEAALEALLRILPALGGPQAIVACQTLASIAVHTAGMWNQVSPKLLEYLTSSKVAQGHELILPVSAVVMQLHQGASRSPERLYFQRQVCPLLLSRVWGLRHGSRFWVAYGVARKASMMGFHELSESIYFKLSRMVTTVKFRNWLNALYQFSLAQSLLSPSPSPSDDDAPISTTDMIPALSKASAIIYNAMMLLKASDPSSSFPCEFLSVHTSWLNAFYQLLSTCVSFYTLPPPSTSLAHSVERKLRMCVVQFQTVSEQYSKLYSSLFDADLATLEYISLLQRSCLLMASVISSIGLSRRPLVSPGKVSTPITETPLGQLEISDNFNMEYLLGKACRAVFQHSQFMSSSLQALPFCEEHAVALLDCCRMILQVPTQLPKYFFTATQVTDVKLALSPPLPAAGQHISLNIDNHFSLKVEGVVEQHSGCGNARFFRSPTAVHIQVQPKLEKLFASDAKPPELTTLVRTEPMEKDYFQAQFLLTLPTPGYYTVHVDAQLLDRDGRVWHLGHRAKFSVVVDSEDNFRLQQKQRDIAATTAATQSSQAGGGKGGHPKSAMS